MGAIDLNLNFRLAFDTGYNGDGKEDKFRGLFQLYRLSGQHATAIRIILHLHRICSNTRLMGRRGIGFAVCIR